MNNMICAAALALLLVGCDGDREPEPGEYLLEDIQVEFDNRDEEGNKRLRQDVQARLVSQLKESGKGIYYRVTPTDITLYGYGKTSHGSLAEGRVQMDGIWHSVIPGRNHSLRLVTDKGTECAFYDCQITVSLKKVPETSPELLARKQQFAGQAQAWQQKLAREHEQFMHIPMPDVPGTLFSPADGFTLKLPFKVQESVHAWVSSHYRRQLDRLTIDKVAKPVDLSIIDEAAEDRANDDSDNTTLVYGFSDDPTRTRSSGKFIVVNGSKEDIDLTRWLAAQNGVVFRSQYGAVYYTQSDELEVLYIQFDEATQRYLIGISTADSIESAARQFALLRTMDARYRGHDVITLAELTLPQAQLEARYQTTVEALINRAEAHHNINYSLQLHQEKPARFMNQSAWVSDVSIPLTSGLLSPKVAISLDTRSVSERIAEAQRLHPEGKATGDLFIYGERYSYYRDTGNGMTVAFTVPEEVGSLVERIMVLSVLRQFDMASLPSIPAEERRNLLTYSDKRFATSEPTDRFFMVYEGIINSRGDLIIPNPADGYFTFEDRAPWLVVRKWTGDREGEERKTPEGFIFNGQGELQLHIATFGSLIDNRLLVGGDGKKQGIYDLNARRWLAAPAWDVIKWKDGIFIASDDETDGSRYARQYLVDTQGQVLATGRMIDIIHNTDRLTVIGEDNNVSLIDRQGQVLFSRVGDVMNYIPQIDAYSVLISPPGRRERSLGIFSERGETILPMEYGHVQVAGDRLKVWMPDMEKVVWFDLEQVKNWRDNQPLKPVPAP